MKARVGKFFLGLLLISFCLSLANFYWGDRIQSHSWRTAARFSSKQAPNPKELKGVAIVQVYSAATYGWRGVFAEHPWIVFKRAGDTKFTRYDVIGFRQPNIIQKNYAVADGYWYGAKPMLRVDYRGAAAQAMIPQIEQAIKTYPFPHTYRSYPGPNSNTFLAHIARSVPELRLDLPANAIGKDYRPFNSPVGLSPTGHGAQVNLLGLLGISAGWEEGVELNVLAINVGVDLNKPALRLPFIGRVGLRDISR